MSTENDPNQQHEDYVLVPKRKMKLSRARKFTVIAMVVGAVVSIAGAGTFASFSASTSNDAGFTTARLALENGGPTGCTSPAGIAGNGATDSAITNNEATNCPTLFPNPLKPGGTPTSATVTIKNVGDVASNIYLFTDAACGVTYATSTFNRGDATDLCAKVLLSVQDVATPACLYGTNADGTADTCDTLTDSVGLKFSEFSHQTTGKNFANKILAASNVAPGATVTFTVKVRMKLISGDGQGACTTDNNPQDGFDDSNGRGCSNSYQNQKATLNFRWLAQAT
jgi:hypothetical protein